MSTAHAIAINAQRVRAHYDRVSKWYSLLCGEHIHQGYWEGVGSIREAQEQLIEWNFARDIFLTPEAIELETQERLLSILKPTIHLTSEQSSAERKPPGFGL